MQTNSVKRCLPRIIVLAPTMLLLLLLLLLLCGCGPSSEEASAPKTLSSSQQSDASGPPKIVVTSEFLRQAGQLLAKDLFEVRRIVPDTTKSPNWRPKRADIETMRSAQMIIMNGAGYEPWKDRVSLPASRVIDTSSGYTEQLIRIPDAVTHQHGPDGKHSHAGFVSATWLDPVLAAAQLTELEKAMSSVEPALKQQFARETSPLKAQLEAIDRDLESLKQQLDPSKVVIVSDSPAVSYLTRRLSAELKYLHWETPESPTESNYEELQNLCKDLPDASRTRFFLLNSRCPDAAEARIKAAGFVVVRIDLLEHPENQHQHDRPQLIERLDGNVQRLKTAISSVRDEGR